MSAETPAQATPAADPAVAAAGAEGAAPAGPSKSELKKRAKEAEKAKKAAERAAREEEERKKREAAASVDNAAQNYGKLPMHQSQERNGREWLNFADITDADVGKEVVVRARLQNTRPQGAKIVFFQFRQQTNTIQGVLVATNKEDDPHQVSKQMLTYAKSITAESLVVIEGVIKKADVKSCSIQGYEIGVYKLYTAVEAQALPFSIEDASRAEADFERAEKEEGLQYARVSLPTRLDNRVMDLRTPANQAIFRIQSGICQVFREHLNSLGFIEIHTPKLQGAATESGSSVFKVKYFDSEAFLAQSPQLAKQMCIAADMGRVYEIAPVFRAEDSNTYRHMTEFMGLDIEMAITEHYHEVLETLDSTFKAIFTALETKFFQEVEVVRKQFGGEPFVFLEKTPIINFKDGIKMLIEAGAKELDGSELKPDADLSTENEKFLGRLIKEKYGTDYFIMDKFPAGFRPFYSMPDPADPSVVNSYDFYFRGEEILSGAQRIHDPEFLTERLKSLGMDPAQFKSYIDSFRLGCPPHGGGGIGLERVVFLYLALGNIRRASLFPRDPKRLAP